MDETVTWREAANNSLDINRFDGIVSGIDALLTLGFGFQVFIIKLVERRSHRSHFFFFFFIRSFSRV